MEGLIIAVLVVTVMIYYAQHGWPK